MELCWLTTSKCNQHCGYCDRMLDTAVFTEKEYRTVLNKLISYNVRNLTFGGGESLLVDCFAKIVKTAAEHDIHLKLVTNGLLLRDHRELIPYFDEITLSIDSADSAINELLGRGTDHFENICSAVALIRADSSKTLININTVATSANLEAAAAMAVHITNWNIRQWRIFRFCPLRGIAVRNRARWEIKAHLFNELRARIEKLRLNCAVQFRDYDDMNNGYLLISPAGKLCVSRDLQDIVVGDMLSDELSEWFA